MLVLSRRNDEDLLIGDDVTVRVVRIHGGNVELGIIAPGQMNIARRELKIPRCTKRDQPLSGDGEIHIHF